MENIAAGSGGERVNQKRASLRVAWNNFPLRRFKVAVRLLVIPGLGAW
jgi:hypothetical protein